MSAAFGPTDDQIGLEFALEAKCYAPDNGVNVRDLSRLTSRLRHRQLGVLVTTSYLGDQAYTQLRQDGHPVVVLAAADIVTTLQRHGVMTPADVQAWLHGLLGPASQPPSP